MSKGLVFLLVVAALFFCASCRTLQEDLLLQHSIDWFNGQSCGGAYLYDEDFGGPGGLPASFITLAQSIADDLYTSNSSSINATDFISTIPCSFNQFISRTSLSTVNVNIFNDVLVVEFTGALIDFGTLSQNADYRRILTCSIYDNLSFGLRIDNATDPYTITFVIVAAASNPNSPCTSGDTVLTPITNFMCPSTCGSVEATIGAVTYIPAPTVVAESVIESDTEILIWRETEIVLSEPQTLDLLSSYATFNAPRGGDLAAVTPNDGDVNSTLPAGTSVTTWFMKFDPVGTTNPTPMSVSGSVVFKNPIIGAIFTEQYPTGSRNRLSESDPTFSTYCVDYNSNINDPKIWRGLEFSTLLNVSDSFTIDYNTFVVNRFEAKQLGVDNVRIFTECNDGPQCHATANASGSASIIAPPASISPNALLSNTTTFVFRERTWILSGPLNVDYVVTSLPINYTVQNPSGPAPTLPAGMAVTSWYFHSSGPARTVTNATLQGINYIGSVTFQDPIIAFIFRADLPTNNVNQQTLLATDGIFGATCTSYSGFHDPQTYRGLEPNVDMLAVDSTGYTVTYFSHVTNGQDDFRILTQCGGGN